VHSFYYYLHQRDTATQELPQHQDWIITEKAANYFVHEWKSSRKPFFLECHYPHRWTVLWPQRSPDLTFTDLDVQGHPQGMFTHTQKWTWWATAVLPQQHDACLEIPSLRWMLQWQPQLWINTPVEVNKRISPPSGYTIILYLLLYTTLTFFGQKSWPFSGSYKFGRSESRTWPIVINVLIMPVPVAARSKA
jgi:hypothetical protein